MFLLRQENRRTCFFIKTREQKNMFYLDRRTEEHVLFIKTREQKNMVFVKTREHENKREGEGLIEQNGEHEVWLGFCPTLVVLSSINQWIFHFSLFT